MGPGRDRVRLALGRSERALDWAILDRRTPGWRRLRAGRHPRYERHLADQRLDHAERPDLTCGAAAGPACSADRLAVDGQRYAVRIEAQQSRDGLGLRNRRRIAPGQVVVDL